jgi:DNA-binding CsgD family transcriptional regulator
VTQQQRIPPPALAVLTGLAGGASGGAVLHGDGRTAPFPELPLGPLLTAGSPAVAAACERLATGAVHDSFLWPLGGPHAPGGHTRVTVLAAGPGAAADVAGFALTSPGGAVRGLTPRELEILGLLVDGLSNWEIARTLCLARRTVAAHIEHILAKLAAATRTSAAVRAVREGLYVPAAAGAGTGVRPARGVWAS